MPSSTVLVPMGAGTVCLTSQPCGGSMIESNFLRPRYSSSIPVPIFVLSAIVRFRCPSKSLSIQLPKRKAAQRKSSFRRHMIRMPLTSVCAAAREEHLQRQLEVEGELHVAQLF